MRKKLQGSIDANVNPLLEKKIWEDDIDFKEVDFIKERTELKVKSKTKLSIEYVGAKAEDFKVSNGWDFEIRSTYLNIP